MLIDAVLGGALVGLCAVVALAGWVIYQLVLSTGRLLMRAEDLERQVDELAGKVGEDEAAPTGLPVGRICNDFELPDLSGGRMTLSQWQGHRVLLIFFSPDCQYSRSLLPALASLSADSADGRPVPLIVTTGSVEANGLLRDGYALRVPVLVQDDWEVGALYGVTGTPMGYLIDEGGAVMSDLLVGSDALLTFLACSTVTNGIVPVRFGAGKTTPRSSKLWPDRVYAERWPAETGLPTGVPAPDFRLPRADGGGDIALADYQGRRVLLVFSDPACGPCNELAPELEQRHRTTSEPQILMVSRRGQETNQSMIAEHGLTFPVVLQRHSELSRDYGMIAMPVAYLIDEHGAIAANVAIGTEAILTLAMSASGHPIGQKGAPIER